MGKAIQLPFPPSANALFTPTGKRGVRGKKAAYHRWIHDAGLELMIQRPEKHDGMVTVDIVATMPDNRVRDIDNLQKPCLDLLVRHQVIVDDNVNYLKKLSIAAAPDGADSLPGLTVIVTGLDEWAAR